MKYATEFSDSALQNGGKTARRLVCRANEANILSNSAKYRALGGKLNMPSSNIIILSSFRCNGNTI